MYRIMNMTENTEAYADDVVLVKLHSNGCYTNPRKGEQAQGFAALVPVLYKQPIYPEREDGSPDYEAEPIGYEDVETKKNQVFYFEKKMREDGDECHGKYEEVAATPILDELTHDLEQAYELMYG